MLQQRKKKKKRARERERKRGMEGAPLLPRIDRLDILMKYIENKHNLWRWSSGTISPFERRCVPVDLALREAHMKGSVLDRVALLEHRLTELTLEMEANSISSSSTVHTFQSPSTMQRSINRQQSDDDFYSLDGRSQGDSHYEVNTHILSSQVNGVRKAEGMMRESHPMETAESSLAAACKGKSKTKRRSRKSCRCKRLLGC